jgi:hypothetical protein
VLYLRNSNSNASPKAISGRTSYLRVRLEFHPYTQVIPALFNVRGFGPPLHFTATSTCPGVDHSVSGLRPRTFALFRRAFAAAPASRLNLARDRNSPVHSTKGTPSPVNGLRLIVGTRFQVLFHSAPAVLFTFPSRYWFTIGRQDVFSLRRWSSQIPTGFHVSRGTWGECWSGSGFGYETFTLFGGPFQTLLLPVAHSVLHAPQPRQASLTVWATPLSLAATQGITVVFFSSGYLDVSVPLVYLDTPMDSAYRIIPLRMMGFPIRKFPDQSLLTAPRDISALAPSFIGTWRQGILRAPFVA